jgi:hypothetical protein
MFYLSENSILSRFLINELLKKIEELALNFKLNG